MTAPSRVWGLIMALLLALPWPSFGQTAQNRFVDSLLASPGGVGFALSLGASSRWALSKEAGLRLATLAGPGPRADTGYFLAGRAADRLGETVMAADLMTRVSDETGLFYLARLSAVELLSRQGRCTDARHLLDSLTENYTLGPAAPAATLLSMGLDVLTDAPARAANRPLPPTADSALAHELRYIQGQAHTLMRLPRRRAGVAAGLSALVPGLGKVYAGDRAQGLATFLSVALFSGLAVENYLRHGVGNPQLYAFGGLAGVFYLGGIYGSAQSVYRRRATARATVHENIRTSLRQTIAP